MLQTQSRSAYGPDHEQFRETVRRFIAEQFTPNIDHWEAEGLVPRAFWKAAGENGLLCPQVPEEYGGLALDFRFNCVVNEELSYAGCTDNLTLQSDVSVPYVIRYGTPEQKTHWLPRMASGDTVSAIAMTEPGAGSDLQGIRTTALRDGDHYVVNGSKTYITNGQNADLVLLVVKTDPSQGAKGTSMLLVDADTPGFQRGRNLDKIGQHSSDTSELFFEDMRVPVSCLLGEENRGFIYLVSELPQERLSISVSAQAAAQRAFDEALAFTKERTAFGKKIIDFQNSRFKLAAMSAKLQVGWAHLDWAINRHVAGELTTQEAAASKLWHTETQWEILDAALQLHGGAGYMNEYAIAKLWRDGRVRRIYGGSSEIMMEMVGRGL